jgi:uncharacterized membrane protein YphA (DoxX/SURF4 family)
MMNTAIWIVQILAGLMFAISGFAKATQPHAKMAETMKWVEDFSPTIVKAIGILEVLGGIGLILPALTGILPILTPIAGIGLVIVMVGAIFTHIRRKEYSMIAINLVLLALAAFVAYGRFVAVPL